MGRLVAVLMVVAAFVAPAMAEKHVRMVITADFDVWPQLETVSCEESVDAVRGFIKCWSCRVRDVVVFGVPVEWVTFLETRGRVNRRVYWVPPGKVLDVAGLLRERVGPPRWEAWSSWGHDKDLRNILVGVSHEMTWRFEWKGRRYEVEIGGQWSRPPGPLSEEVDPCHPRGLEGRWRRIVVENLGPAEKGGKPKDADGREGAGAVGGASQPGA